MRHTNISVRGEADEKVKQAGGTVRNLEDLSTAPKRYRRTVIFQNYCPNNIFQLETVVPDTFLRKRVERLGLVAYIGRVEKQTGGRILAGGPLGWLRRNIAIIAVTTSCLNVSGRAGA
jgi:hypothetical protein